MKKYQVIFYDSYDEVPYTEQYFNSKIEAEKWVEDNEWDKQVEFWGDNGPEYKTQYYYHNPQDQQNYTGYEIKLISELNEEFLRMQKLAGLITEEEYKAKFQELDLMNLSNKISKKVDLIKQHLKNQGYDI
jgi:hypothetical protein